MREISPENTVSFTRMDRGTAQDYALLEKLEGRHRSDVACLRRLSVQVHIHLDKDDIPKLRC